MAGTLFALLSVNTQLSTHYMEFIAGFFTFFLFLVCAAIWLLPIILIAGSDRTSGA